MKSLALALIALAAAPVHGVEVGRVQVQLPVGAYMSGAAAVGADASTRLGQLSPASLTGSTSLSVTAKLAPPVLVPSVIPTAPQPVLDVPQSAGYSAPIAPAQTVTGQTAAPLSMPSALAPADGSALSQPMGQQQNAPAAAVKTLQGFVAQMESSRVAGKDISGDLSGRFFDQSAPRGPPLVAATAEASDVAAPKLPRGLKSVSVDTIRTAEDVDRLIPDWHQIKNHYVQEYLQELTAGLKTNLASMAPYSFYTYVDRQGGKITAFDLASKPGIVDQIPDMQPHEIKLIKRLMLINSDIRVVVREDGKTPDLIIGDQVVEMKSVLNDYPMEALVDKANTQVLVHGQRHGLGHGAMALDLPEEKSIPLAKVENMLNVWQAKTAKVVLDKVMVFSQTDIKVLVRQPDGTYQLEAPAAMAPSVVNERPLAPAERGRAQAMLRNGVEKSPVLALSL